jgi:CRISPR/Cas system CSM-associated protein Csm2 small subunit
MSLALRKEDFDFLPAEPAVDWQKAFELVNDLKDFERTIDKADAQMARWRARMLENIKSGFAKMDAAFDKVPQDEVREIVLPMIAEAIIALEDTKRAYSVPFHEQHGSALAKLGAVSGGPGRFLRKQINRVEDIRVKQFNACTDMYYALLAFRSKYEDRSGSDTFDSADDLEAFLKSQV